MGRNIWFTAANEGRIGVLDLLLKNNIPGADYLNQIKQNIWQVIVMSPGYYSTAPHEQETDKVLQWLLDNKIPGRERLMRSIDTELGVIVMNGSISELDWLLKVGWIDREKIAKLLPDIWNFVANFDIEYSPASKVKWLIKNKISGSDFIDEDGNNIWLVDTPYIDIGDIITLLFDNNIPGRNHLNNEGVNVWLNAARNGSRRALELLDKNHVRGRSM